MIRINLFVIPEYLCRKSGKTPGSQLTGSPTQASRRTPVLRLTAMLRMLTIFPEDLYADDVSLKLTRQ